MTSKFCTKNYKSFWEKLKNAKVNGGSHNEHGWEDNNGKMPILSKLTFHPIKILADFCIESDRLICVRKV